MYSANSGSAAVSMAADSNGTWLLYWPENVSRPLVIGWRVASAYRLEYERSDYDGLGDGRHNAQDIAEVPHTVDGGRLVQLPGHRLQVVRHEERADAEVGRHEKDVAEPGPFDVDVE